MKMDLTRVEEAQTGFIRDKWQVLANTGKGPISFSRKTAIHRVNFQC
jgi:hypothetical protein